MMLRLQLARERICIRTETRSTMELRQIINEGVNLLESVILYAKPLVIRSIIPLARVVRRLQPLIYPCREFSSHSRKIASWAPLALFRVCKNVVDKVCTRLVQSNSFELKSLLLVFV